MDWTATVQEIDLSDLDQEYARAEMPSREEGASDEVPDGAYETTVEDATLARTHTTGNAMLVWRLRIQGPQCTGRSLVKVRVITAKTLGFLKEDLRRLGVALEKLSDLQYRLEEMIGLEIGVFKRTNPDRRWSDVYFMRRNRREDSQQHESVPTNDLPF